MAEKKPEIIRTPEEEKAIKKKFDMFLTEEIDPEKLLQYEREYYKGSDRETDMEMQHYNYADALIRSRHSVCIHRGITLMEGLTDVNPEEKVRSWFMMSLGYARLGQYKNAIIFLNIFLKKVKLIGTMELIDWKKYLEAKKKQQEEKVRTKRVACILHTTSAVVLVSALVGLSYVALKQ